VETRRDQRLGANPPRAEKLVEVEEHHGLGQVEGCNPVARAPGVSSREGLRRTAVSCSDEERSELLKALVHAVMIADGMLEACGQLTRPSELRGSIFPFF
jgi:hypothetical protein